MSTEFPLHTRVEDELGASGAPFELVEASVLDVQMQVFKDRGFHFAFEPEVAGEAE